MIAQQMSTSVILPVAKAIAKSLALSGVVVGLSFLVWQLSPLAGSMGASSVDSSSQW